MKMSARLLASLELRMWRLSQARSPATGRAEHAPARNLLRVTEEPAHVVGVPRYQVGSLIANLRAGERHPGAVNLAWSNR
jgi:hypothetical protein